MSTQRVQRQVERMLRTVEFAVDDSDRHCVECVARDVLALDPDYTGAVAYLGAADRRKLDWDIEPTGSQEHLDEGGG